MNPVAEQARYLIEHPGADGRRQIARRVHGDDPADPPLVDGAFREAHARVEPADVTDHEGAPRRVGRLDDRVAVLDRAGHGLFEKHVLTRPERR